MEMVLALKGQNFTMVACDTTLSNPQGLILIRNDLTKFHPLQENFLLVTTGSYSDIRVLVKFIKAEMQLHRMQFEKEFTHHELTRKIRLILAEHFSWEPLKVIATYVNEKEGPQIKVIEAGKEIQSFDIVGHGMLGSEVCTSCLQPVYRPNLSEEQAYLVLEESVKILMARMPINYPAVRVAVVSGAGISVRPDIRSGSMA